MVKPGGHLIHTDEPGGRILSFTERGQYMAAENRANLENPTPCITGSDSVTAGESRDEHARDETQSACGTDRDHEEYMSHRERLSAVEQYYARSYDKWLLTLSGGALALSMALCKDVVVGTPQGTHWLLASWILFAAAILSTLTCILLSHGAHEKDVEILDRIYEEHEEHWQRQVSVAQGAQWRQKAIGWLNRASLVCFVAGLCLLAYFASQNIVKNGEDDVGPKQAAGDVTAAKGSHHWKTQK